MSGGLGWEIATYAQERLRPAAGMTLSATLIWDDYRRWCAGREAVPLAEAVFHERFASLAGEVGIPERFVQGNVNYWDVAFREVADVDAR